MDFLRRHTLWLALATAFLFASTVALLFLFQAARDTNITERARVDRPLSLRELPGPLNKLSDRSKEEIRTMLSETPHVLGGWVVKVKYEKTEYPVIFSWFKDPIFNEILKKYRQRQESGKGFSSAELAAPSAPPSLQNSEELRTGLIKCSNLEATNLTLLAPELKETSVKSICRATIPPFDENVNIGIIVLVDIPADNMTTEIKDIRRMLLRLQIDLFNRDWQGRETWIRDN